MPLLIRGPGIEPGITVPDLAANIDLAPTIVDMGGMDPASLAFDGISLLPAATAGQFGHAASSEAYSRDKFLVEYHGEGDCQKSLPAACRGIADGNMCECSQEWDCKCQVGSNRIVGLFHFQILLGYCKLCIEL